jgi:hypothetical protein
VLIRLRGKRLEWSQPNYKNKISTIMAAKKKAVKKAAPKKKAAKKRV